MFIQLQYFLSANHIFETFQSGFKPLHRTESALLRVLNDTLLATDSGDSVILILLDLTSAFDTVDHKTLLSRLEYFVGIQGTVLSWFKSYLTNRSFSVILGNFSSLPAKLSCGVPQGSILAPILFSLYLLPLGSIFRKHGVSFVFYSLLRIKTLYGFRRLGMQHDLFVMLLYCLFMVSFCNKYL